MQLVNLVYDWCSKEVNNAEDVNTVELPFEQEKTAPTTNVKLALLVINPKISTNGNKTFTESFRWSEPIDLTNETHTSLEIASDGAVDFEIAETHYASSLFTNKTDGSSLLADELYNQISTLSSSEIERMNYSFDYLQMVEAYDFCNKN